MALRSTARVQNEASTGRSSHSKTAAASAARSEQGLVPHFVVAKPEAGIPLLGGEREIHEALTRLSARVPIDRSRTTSAWWRKRSPPL